LIIIIHTIPTQFMKFFKNNFALIESKSLKYFILIYNIIKKKHKVSKKSIFSASLEQIYKKFILNFQKDIQLFESGIFLHQENDAVRVLEILLNHLFISDLLKNNLLNENNIDIKFEEPFTRLRFYENLSLFLDENNKKNFISNNLENYHCLSIHESLLANKFNVIVSLFLNYKNVFIIK